MRRLALLVVTVFAAVVVLVAPGAASAHPLGNFTVNHFTAVDLAGNGVFLRYSLDLAEIPTFQVGAEVRRPGYAADLARKLELTVDDKRVPLVVLSHRAVERPGAGGLKTLRFDAVFRATASGNRLGFSDRAFSSRIGWREIVVSARDGAKVVSSTAPAESLSEELRAYPKSLLTSPLDVRSATVTYRPGSADAVAPTIGTALAPAHRGSGFESLIGRGELSLGVILVSLLIAAFWGAVHALTPGHGKALVAGYLVGTRGTPRHAFVLGATVTVTHTAGVFALGLVTLLLSRFIVPDQLYPWLTFASGVMIVVVGAAVLRQRLVSGDWTDHTHGADHSHDGGHHHHHHGSDGHGEDHHDHGHHHDQDAGEQLSSRGILGVGIAAGLLPCPSALVVLLSAIAIHRIGFGFALITAFSLGLAATITAIGLIAVLARRALGRASLEGRVVRALPAASALVILCVGVALTVKALPGVI